MIFKQFLKFLRGWLMSFQIFQWKIGLLRQLYSLSAFQKFDLMSTLLQWYFNSISIVFHPRDGSKIDSRSTPDFPNIDPRLTLGRLYINNIRKPYRPYISPISTPYHFFIVPILPYDMVFINVYIYIYVCVCLYIHVHNDPAHFT